MYSFCIIRAQKIAFVYRNSTFVTYKQCKECKLNKAIKNSKFSFFLCVSIANASESFHQFELLGSRGPNGQSSVSFLDPNSGILIYALTNLNAIACWRTGTKYTIQQQGRVYTDNVTMVFPNDIKVCQLYFFFAYYYT